MRDLYAGSRTLWWRDDIPSGVALVDSAISGNISPPVVRSGDGVYSERTFIDLFAGVGGLSLGLMQNGWRGILAVEKHPVAFETLSRNLIHGKGGLAYRWPDWFPKEPHSVAGVLDVYREQLLRLRGRVTMIAGGPPCQGFSLAGRREPEDIRNLLFEDYMRIVEMIQPLFVLIENVRGIAVAFNDTRTKRVLSPEGRREPFSHQMVRSLHEAGYEVQGGLLSASDYGVPQSRPRFFLIATRRGVSPPLSYNAPFEALADLREGFLLSKGLPAYRPVSAREAISDLEAAHGTMPCVDSPRSLQGAYGPPTTTYQRLMRGSSEDGTPDSHRLTNHTPEMVERLAEILSTCRKGVQLNPDDRRRFGLRKQRTVPLDPDAPSPTLTTVPEDLIHYSEARILTVREHARLQSIPDWFRFLGPYRTGGGRGSYECPRYTQVGNAVPPLLGEAIGAYFADIHARYLA